MKFHRAAAPAGQSATHLWLLLPGAYMKPADFIEAGFVAAVRDRGLAHDVALLEADIAEVANGSARLFLQDFLRTLPERPPRRVCLVGISLGAHLALTCLARACRDQAQAQAAARVDAALLLAPYLGPRDLVAEVASDCRVVHATTTQPEQQDIDREIWRWLRKRPAGAPDLYLGYGAGDRFAKAHALMARTLPAGHVDVQPGGHAWPVWTALWNRHLDRHYGH